MTVKTLHISNTQVLKLSSEINSKHSKEFHYFKRLWGGGHSKKNLEKKLDIKIIEVRDKIGVRAELINWEIYKQI